MAEPIITAGTVALCACHGRADCAARCHGADAELLAFQRLLEVFSEAMLEKFLASRNKGRRGWDKGDWSAECARIMKAHCDKGDPVDVAILAAFLFNMREVS